MSAKFIETIKSGPPPPRVALLPDSRFFARTVPVTPTATPAEAATEIELALEGMSPFPPAQLYFGYHWVPGSPHALVFSCYRKRFTVDEHSEWGTAALVAPTFAALLTVPHEPATNLITPSGDGLTVIHWDEGAIPTNVVHASLPPEADDATRARVRDDLLREAGGSRSLIELTAPPEISVSPDEKHYNFVSGEFTARVPLTMAATFDVRDPGELAAWRASVRRDVMIWRTAAGSVAALIVLALAQLGLTFGGRVWDEALTRKKDAQSPAVLEIQSKDSLATSVEDRSSKRLLPLEMVTTVGVLQSRGSIVISQAAAPAPGADSIYSLRITGTTDNASEFQAFRTAISQLPAVANLDSDFNSRGTQVSFTMTITFKPGAIEPGAQPELATNQ